MAEVHDTSVLIVGAGPSGMVLANELCRRRIGCRLIERKSEPTQTSRSFTLHARTMEMFEHMGLAHRFLEHGIKSRGFYFNFKDKPEHPTLDFTSLKSRYPFILVYNQNETEQRLREHLDAMYDLRPEWGTELTALETETDGYNATLVCDAGSRRETVHAEWVVGCDGIHSFVRKSTGLGFEGENYEGMVMQMMDVRTQGFDEPDDWVHYYMAKENFLLVTKLPGSNHRVLISDMGDAADPNLSPREAFQRFVANHVDGMTLEEPDWATKWTIWKRLATAYRSDRAFLVGDAGHVHSPSGGQGMNVGMQDAFNLGWKLALVASGAAKAELLDTYERERKPIGAQVITGTDAMHDIIMAHGQALEDRIALTRSPGWQAEAVDRISGLSYNYTDVSDAPSAPGGPLPGQRAPDAALTSRTRLYDLLRHTRLTQLLILTDARMHAVCADIAATTQARFGRAVKTVVIGTETLPEIPAAACILADASAFTRAYASSKAGEAYVIRPDGYVAAHTPLEPGGTFEYLERWLSGSG